MRGGGEWAVNFERETRQKISRERENATTKGGANPNNKRDATTKGGRNRESIAGAMTCKGVMILCRDWVSMPFGSRDKDRR